MIKKFFDASKKKHPKESTPDELSEAEQREQYFSQLLTRIAKGDMSDLPTGHSPMEKAIREIGGLLGDRQHVINGMVDLTQESGFLQHFAEQSEQDQQQAINEIFQRINRQRSFLESTRDNIENSISSSSELKENTSVMLTDVGTGINEGLVNVNEELGVKAQAA